jgi:hypothetical protein
MIMSYAIGNIILGTHLPWDKDEANKVLVAMVEADPQAFAEEGETREDVIEAAKDGAFELADAFDGEPWHKEYHGGADSPVAWVGVLLDTFDETNHIPFSQLRVIPTPEQMAEAGNAVASLPEGVRKLLPPISIYVVWSTS